MNESLVEQAKAHLASPNGEQDFIDFVGKINSYQDASDVLGVAMQSPNTTENCFFAILDAYVRSCPNFPSPSKDEWWNLKPGFADWVKKSETLWGVLYDNCDRKARYRKAFRDFCVFTFNRYMEVKDSSSLSLMPFHKIALCQNELGKPSSLGLTKEFLVEVDSCGTTAMKGRASYFRHAEKKMSSCFWPVYNLFLALSCESLYTSWKVKYCAKNPLFKSI